MWIFRNELDWHLLNTEHFVRQSPVRNTLCERPESWCIGSLRELWILFRNLFDCFIFTVCCEPTEHADYIRSGDQVDRTQSIFMPLWIVHYCCCVVRGPLSPYKAKRSIKPTSTTMRDIAKGCAVSSPWVNNTCKRTPVKSLFQKQSQLLINLIAEMESCLKDAVCG